MLEVANNIGSLLFPFLSEYLGASKEATSVIFFLLPCCTLLRPLLLSGLLKRTQVTCHLRLVQPTP
jgi:hypothetical protein